ncbi:hypothetical protein F511_26280 [Dorcoceras hygrometricum]|uniref:Uncharacterized protein n=1 Tax=Dorcoceras hygrometricum TaxID=472368 RepID=A0A2Z7D969_9LAMI|nr:hypothetical protein F511_26280 [Dorcoceras hygrometricum]
MCLFVVSTRPDIGSLVSYLAGDLRLAPTGITRRPALHGITDSACKNQLVVVSVQYGPFNQYIPIRSTTIGKSRVVIDPIAMHRSWRSNSDIASVTRDSMSFRVMRTNQYNQDLGLIHSTNGNHLESPNEGSSIDHQVTIHPHAQNITMFPTNETWEHCDVLNIQMDSDLVIYRTTLVRTFQVVTICRVDKSESTGCVLGKWVCLVTLMMSLFDLQDVCIVIGSLATLDLSMVVDLIGIYVLKGPYCMLTTFNWFLQELSVIPKGSWGDVARRFTMIRWANPGL